MLVQYGYELQPEKELPQELRDVTGLHWPRLVYSPNAFVPILVMLSGSVMPVKEEHW